MIHPYVRRLRARWRRRTAGPPESRMLNRLSYGGVSNQRIDGFPVSAFKGLVPTRAVGAPRPRAGRLAPGSIIRPPTRAPPLRKAVAMASPLSKNIAAVSNETRWDIISVAIILVCITSLIAGRTLRQARRKLPPGPRGLPLLGNAHQLPVTFPERALLQWGTKYGTHHQLHRASPFTSELLLRRRYCILQGVPVARNCVELHRRRSRPAGQTRLDLLREAAVSDAE